MNDIILNAKKILKKLDLIEKLKGKIKWHCDSCISEEKYVIKQSIVLKAIADINQMINSSR